MVVSMKIGTRFAIVLALFLLMQLLTACVGVWRLHDMSVSAKQLGQQANNQLKISQQWHAAIELNLARSRGALLDSDPKKMDQWVSEIDKTSQVISELGKRLVEFAKTDKEQALLAQVGVAREAYRGPRALLFNRRASGEDVSTLLQQELVPLSDAYLKSLDKVSAHYQNEFDRLLKQVDENASLGEIILILTSVLVFGGGGVFMLNRSIVLPIRSTVEKVTTITEKLARRNNDLSQRTEGQASALEETAAAMEELDSSAHQNADNVKKANHVAQGASQIASQGNTAVSEMIETMRKINEASNKIANFSSMIDRIAFQTNILALNAAVEAARAGEQGRGFGVVANEVRTLAQRSAESAKEINQLIATSVERTEQGMRLVQNVGSTMSDIVGAIHKVTSLMDEINLASNEQSSSVAQISSAVSQLDRNTQQNASMVEEMAAATAGLRKEAIGLALSVGAPT
jgi:methyl-accepting chemotaxis protein